MDRDKIIKLLESGAIDEVEAVELFEAFGIEMDEDFLELIEEYEHADEDEDEDDEAEECEDVNGAEFRISGFDINGFMDKISEKIDKKLNKLSETIDKKVAESAGSHSQKTDTEDAEEANVKGYSVVVKLGYSDVSIRHGEELAYRFINLETGEYEENPENIVVNLDAEKLRITDNFYKNIGSRVAAGDIGKKVINMFGFSAVTYPRYRVELTIPKNQRYALAKLHTKSGSIFAENISTVEKLDVNSVSGSIVLNDCIGENIVVSGVSGEIRLAGISANKSIINTVSGSVEFAGKTPSLNLNTVSGSVRVINEMLLYKSSINTVSGSVRCYIKDENRQNLTIAGKFKQRTKDRINGEAGTSLKLSTVSGSVRVADLSEFEE